jgi:hypothetical protein
MSFDDELHDALTRTAERTTPDVDAAWNALPTRTDQPRGRRLPLLAGAAAILVLLIGAAAFVVRQRDDADVTTDRPDAVASTSIPATPQSTTSTTEPAGPVAPDVDAPMPREAVAVTDDGRLVVLDTASGEPLRQLASAGDPAAPLPPEGAAGLPNVINAVDVDPQSGTVMYSECCEPISGEVFEVPLDGSIPPTSRGGGLDPSIDGDARFSVAASSYGLILLTGNDAHIPLDGLLPEAYGLSTQDPTWVLDERTIAFSLFPGTHVALGVLVQDEADQLTAAAYAPPDGQSWTDPVPWIGPSGDAAVLVAQQCCSNGDPFEHDGRARSVVLDVTTGSVLEELAPYDGVVVDQELATTAGGVTCCSPWLLVTYADGRLEGRNLLSGELVAIGDGYLAAAW